jgi:hypothetical protein
MPFMIIARPVLQQNIMTPHPQVTSHHLLYWNADIFSDEPTLQPLARRLWPCHNFYHQLLSFRPFTFSVTMRVSEDAHLNL